MPNTSICQARAACQVDVSDSVAGFDELNDGVIGQVDAVAKVNVVQVLGQFADCRNGSICDMSAFGKDQVA